LTLSASRYSPSAGPSPWAASAWIYGNIYATAALVGASVYLLVQQAGLNETAATYIGMSTVAALRFAAIYWNLQVPVFHYPDDTS